MPKKHFPAPVTPISQIGQIVQIVTRDCYTELLFAVETSIGYNLARRLVGKNQDAEIHQREQHGNMDRQKRTFGAILMVGLLIGLALGAGRETLAKSQAGGGAAGNRVQLIMFEQEGCHYCELWDANIGVFYNTTPEGKFAPLRKVDIHVDDDVPNVKPVVFTPTFVLYKNGREVERLTGYISDDFFWGMLAPLLKKHGFDNKIRESRGAAQKEWVK